jgi:hypothetical protein
MAIRHSLLDGVGILVVEMLGALVGDRRASENMVSESIFDIFDLFMDDDAAGVFLLWTW